MKNIAWGLQHYIALAYFYITLLTEKPETNGVVDVSPETACADDTSKVAELSLCDTLLISNLPEKANELLIEMYFENPRSGGCEGAIKKLHFVKPKVAQVQFKDPQGEKCSESFNVL